GCGDGGVIDALRIVHQEFGRGALTFEIAAALSGTQIAKAIAKAEDAARVADDPAPLEAAYLDAAKRVDSDYSYRKVRRLLRDSLASGVLVRLFDKNLDAPFSLKAAPIHKLILAHARLRGSVIYERGMVEKTPENDIKAGGHVFKPDESRVVIHIGADPSF